MAFWNNDQPVRSLPTTEARTTASSAIMLIDAVRPMPSKSVCNMVYAALADKKDITAADLEELSNKLGRLAWEKART